MKASLREEGRPAGEGGERWLCRGTRAVVGARSTPGNMAAPPWCSPGSLLVGCCIFSEKCILPAHLPSGMLGADAG